LHYNKNRETQLEITDIFFSKRELRIKDSIAQLKLKKQNPTPTAVVKKDSTKKN
jgi:hypothetical protein